MDRTDGLYRCPLITVVISFITIFLWLYFFPLNLPLDRNAVFFEGLYLLGVIAGYFFILRLDAKVLEIGWSLFLYGLLVDFLDEFTKEPDVWNTNAPGIITLLGILIVTVGFYFSQKRRQSELAKSRQAEKIITENEERYRLLAENSLDLIGLLDLEGNVIYASPSHLQVLGYSPSYLVHNSIFDVIHPDDVEAAFSALKAMPTSGHDQRVEMRLRKKAGEWVEVEAILSGVADDAGTLNRILICARDITERKRMERALQKSQERYELAVSSGKVGVWDWNDETGEVYISPSLKAVLGFEDHEIRDAAESWVELVHPDDLKKAVGTANTYLAGLTPQYEVECRMVHKDGGIRWLLISGHAIRDADGRPRRMVGVYTDITDRKQAEESLKESEKRYKDLFENVPTGVYRTTPDGRVLMANPVLVKMLGYSSLDELTSRNLESDGFDASYPRSNFKEIIEREGEVRGLESSWKRRDGTTIFVRENARAVRGEDGAILYYEGTVEDITKSKRTEKTLRENLVQLAKKNRYETIISSITRSIHQSINLQDVLENAVDAMSRNIDGVDNVFISLVEREEAVLKAYRGYPDWFIERVRRIPYPKGVTWKTIMEEKPTYCGDTEGDKILGPAGKEVGTKSYLSMPIRFEGKTVGVINVNSLRRNAFDKEELKLLEVVAQQIEIAIDNARQAEALRQSEERYRALFDQSSVGVYMFDRDFKIVQCNERFIQILKSSYDKVIGLDLMKITDQSFTPVMKRVFEGHSAHYESFYKATTSSAKLWLSVRFSPLLDNSGNVTAGMAVVEDITERKRAEEALRESEEKYRTLLEHSYDLVIETSVDGRFLYVSPKHKEVLGYEPDELIGISVFEHIHPDERQAVVSEFQRAAATFTSGYVVYRFRHKNGEWRWLESTGKPFKTASGEIRGIIASRDITEQKRIEGERLRAQKLESLGALAGGIAHDFNNLLTAILGNISLAKVRTGIEDKTFKRLTEAEKACIRASDLTQQLLTFSIGGAPVKRVTHIGDLIKESASFVLRGSKAGCEFSIPEDLWLIESDEGQISQVVNNLVINADQAMPEGGVIRIKGENVVVDDGDGLPIMKGRYVKITVEDEGEGIHEEYMSKIFDPYFTTKRSGAGLGLATTYSIIKRHDGYIGVESKIGVGTKFCIYLPALHDVEAEECELMEEEPLSGEGRVLVMDDEEIIREVAGEMLSRIGYEVEYARDGSEAIELYRRAKEGNRPFDAVIMDLTVPGGMGGKEAIGRLKEIDPDVKAIVSSGYSNDPVMSEFKKYGFSGFVAKPYRIEELNKTMHEVMNGLRKTV